MHVVVFAAELAGDTCRYRALVHDDIVNRHREGIQRRLAPS
jgi:hypothetical protein